METNLENCTISTLISYTDIQIILPKFSSPLKTNFENRNLWLRFGLALTLSRDSPRSAIQAFIECLRIDQHDPLPAMLAAKLMLEALDDPDDGLQFAKDAIERCRTLINQATNDDNSLSSSSSSTNSSSSSTSSTLSKNSSLSSSPPATASTALKCRYKNIAPLLSKCYLLASIMNAYIYEREPESIRHLKTSNMKASLHYLDLANKTYPNDYLVHFHRALHDARQKLYQSAIDSLRRAIRLNPYHVPSMQLMILSLSALKKYDEALNLCESTLHEFEDNLMLLYIKCNLERCVAETRGYKPALNTAQLILKCLRRAPAISTKDEESQQSNEPRQTTNLFAQERSYLEKQQGLYIDELSIWVLVAEIFIKIGSITDAELCADESSIHANGALSHEIMFIRGLIAKAKNNLIEAKSFFQSCLALCPKHPTALQQIAHVHYLLGNYSTAEKFLKDSLDIDSDCHKTWQYLSLVFIEMNQHEKANECIKKATILEESSPVIPISAISRLTLE